MRTVFLDLFLKHVEQNISANTGEEYIRFVAMNAALEAIPIEKIERESAKYPEIVNLRWCVLQENWSEIPSGYKSVRFELKY